MGRKEQRDRERNRAAKASHSLESMGFLPIKRLQSSEPEPEDAAAVPGSSAKHARTNADVNVGPCDGAFSRAQSDNLADLESSTPMLQWDACPAPQASSSGTLSSTVSKLVSAPTTASLPEYDIGRIFHKVNAKTGEECQKAVSELSDRDKYTY